ncbi:lysozyme [Entamoeba marina]
MLLFCLVIALTYGATYGTDMSSLVSVDSFKCLKDKGYTFAIPRCWRSYGVWDDSCAQTCSNAHDAGIDPVDVYFYPCVSCGNAAGQVSTFWNKIISYGVECRLVWFDIEGTWTSSYSANIDFFEEMMNQARKIGINHGVYVSTHYWSTLFGSDYVYPYASSTPLWYPHYDNNPSFSDFVAFGGFTTPSIKQYKGTTSLCSASVDLSYTE